jgi:hypothetical protein
MSQNSGNQGFLTVLFYPMMGGSRSVPLTKGDPEHCFVCVSKAYAASGKRTVRS